MVRNTISRAMVALLIVGGAISLFSCAGDKSGSSSKANYERLMTETSDNLAMLMSENGQLSYRFEAPLVEGYTLAREPYREFRKGIKITTYMKDTVVLTVNGTLVANYAIYYEKLKLWEAKGDVTLVRSDGKELYSQQLFWNATTKRIYSNVDTKIVDNIAGDTYYGEGFESDEDMEEWSFRRMTGRMGMELKPTQPADSLSSADTQRDSVNIASIGARDIDSLELAPPVDPTPAAETKPKEEKKEAEQSKAQPKKDDQKRGQGSSDSKGRGGMMRPQKKS
ncbi:MAG: LPS export ABC transporter periplasmic protein LptC [Rikenellaceae bacterium]